MTKQGILHDYDLMANMEQSATAQKCRICGRFPMSFQWSDYSGEAMCTQCGSPYQLKWGSDEQIEEGDYPYLNLRSEFIAPIKAYWDKTNQFVCYGRMMGSKPGRVEFSEWMEKHYPELMKE